MLEARCNQLGYSLTAEKATIAFSKIPCCWTTWGGRCPLIVCCKWRITGSGYVLCISALELPATDKGTWCWVFNCAFHPWALVTTKNNFLHTTTHCLLLCRLGESPCVRSRVYDNGKFVRWNLRVLHTWMLSLSWSYSRPSQVARESLGSLVAATLSLPPNSWSPVDAPACLEAAILADCFTNIFVYTNLELVFWHKIQDVRVNFCFTFKQRARQNSKESVGAWSISIAFNIQSTNIVPTMHLALLTWISLNG